MARLREHRVRQAEERLRMSEAWEDLDLVFPSTVGTPLDPRNLTRDFGAVCERAGIRSGRFHNLLHSAARMLLAEGMPLRVIQELLGHSSIQITADTYTHVVPVLLADVADRIDARFGDLDSAIPAS